MTVRFQVRGEDLSKGQKGRPKKFYRSSNIGLKGSKEGYTSCEDISICPRISKRCAKVSWVTRLWGTPEPGVKRP